jgi:putative flippase GtrA
MRSFIIRFIDTFYFLFQRIMPLKTYRYAVCGGSNLVLDIFLYYIFYHFVFAKQNLDLGIVVLSSHIASLLFVFPITFFTGFILNRFIAFDDSDLPWKTQIVRYLSVALGAILLSYLLMKIFVDQLGFYPTISKMITTIISVIYSYLLQSKFSFRAAR